GAADRHGRALGDHAVKKMARVRKWIARNPTPARYILLGCSIASLLFGALLTYSYVSFSRIIDARLHGERERTLPRVYARPLELRRGESLTELELTALMTGGEREKRRRVGLSVIPKRMQEAVLAIEDQSYYSHPGVNPFSMIRAVIANLFSRNKYPIGGSTITQQLARMFFLTDEF